MEFDGFHDLVEYLDLGCWFFCMAATDVMVLVESLPAKEVINLMRIVLNRTETQHSKAKGLGGTDPLRSCFLKGDAISDGEKTYKFRCSMESGLTFFEKGLPWSRNSSCFFSIEGKAFGLTFSAKPVEEFLAFG